MALTKKDRYILKLIMNAQRASDIGKAMSYRGNHIASFRRENTFKKGGYGKKDVLLLQALEILDSSSVGAITYWVESQKICDYNYNDRWTNVIYFTIKTDKRTKQVSFHSFNWSFHKYVGKGDKRRWQKHHSSRRTAQSLEELL